MKKQPRFKGTKVDAATGYVINKDAHLPRWVKCIVCGGPPTPSDWLKPMSNDPACRDLIHISHINEGPRQSKEAGYISRNT